MQNLNLVLKIDWSKINNFSEPYTDEVQDYLKKFSEDFKFTIKLLVQWNIEAAGILKDDSEVMNHARLCINVQKNYLNRPSYIQKVSFLFKSFRYLKYRNLKIGAYLNSEYCGPCVLVGPSGCGKTTFMAQAAKFVIFHNTFLKHPNLPFIKIRLKKKQIQ
jgi:hypothetical protein